MSRLMFCSSTEAPLAAAGFRPTQPEDSWKVAMPTPAVSIIAPIWICARSRSSSKLRSSTTPM